MKLAFILLFIAAVGVQVWKRLSERTRAAIVSKAQAMIKQAMGAAQRLSAKVFRRRTAYRAVFYDDRGQLSPGGKIVLAHLTKFCYALSTTAQAQADRDAIMRREGRRQVWLEIMRELNLDPSQALQAVQEEDVLAAA